MNLWPQKKWKQVLFVLVLAILVVIASFGRFGLAYIDSAVNKDVASGIEIVNPGGNKTALVIYQPGLTSLPKNTSYAFANGLAASGWRVEITTASSQAPSDLSKYSLLVLGFPTYKNSPGTAIVRYVDRAGDLHGINTVIIWRWSEQSGEKRRYHDAESGKSQTAQFRSRFFWSARCSARHGSTRREAVLQPTSPDKLGHRSTLKDEGMQRRSGAASFRQSQTCAYSCVSACFSFLWLEEPPFKKNTLLS